MNSGIATGRVLESYLATDPSKAVKMWDRGHVHEEQRLGSLFSFFMPP